MTGKRGIWILGLSLFTVLYLGSDGIELLVELEWFAAQGYLELFRTILFTELTIGFIVGAIVFGFLYVNLAFAVRQVGVHVIVASATDQSTAPAVIEATTSAFVHASTSTES